jgi:hypothetical protein
MKTAETGEEELVHAWAEWPVLWRIVTAVWGGRSAWRVPSASIAPSAYPFANQPDKIRELATIMKTGAWRHSPKHVEASVHTGD